MENLEDFQQCDTCKKEGFDLSPKGLIQNPGKFEGEPLLAYHLYHFLMDGASEDVISFPDGAAADLIGRFIVWISSDGFVSAEEFRSETAAAEEFARIREEVEEWLETDSET